MQLPKKPVTKLFMLFSMFALMQCCCCMVPIRWRISSIPVPANIPSTAMPGHNSDPGYQIQESSRTEGIAVQNRVGSGPGKTFAQVKQASGIVAQFRSISDSCLQRLALLLRINRH